MTAGNGVWAGRAVGRWVLRLVPTGATKGADGCYDGCTPRWYAGRRRLGGGRGAGRGVGQQVTLWRDATLGYSLVV